MVGSYEYISGLFDGEGCITIGYCKRLRSYSLRASIAMTHRGVLDIVQARVCRGQIHTVKARGNQKESYRWSLYGQQAADFLREIRPWAIVKLPQINLALDFSEQKHSPDRFVPGGWTGKQGQRRRPEVIAAEHVMKQQMHVLNRRGRIPYPVEARVG